MKKLLFVFAVLLAGCNAQNDVTLRAAGDGQMIVTYEINGQRSETTANGTFEERYTGTPPRLLGVMLNSKTGGVKCEIIVNGSIVASDIKQNNFPLATCKP